LLLAWVGFCLVWFFTIYQKEGKKKGDEIAITDQKPEVVADASATDSAYNTSIAETESTDTIQPVVADTEVVINSNTPTNVTPTPNSIATTKNNNINTEIKKEAEEASITNVKVSVCYFYQNSDKKLKNFSSRIAKKIEQCLTTENAKIAITGHTDYVGSSEYNYRLGLQRAERVKQLLIKKGIAAERIVVLSKGEEQPVANNKSITGRARNRRVEINITLS
jgi:outer membrane protein OmpA-like peptidoglycan-associated protein